MKPRTMFLFGSARSMRTMVVSRRNGRRRASYSSARETTFGHQIHSLNDGVDQQDIVKLHPGYGLGVIVLQEGDNGLPFFVSEGAVNLVYLLLHFVHVTLVLPNYFLQT